MEVLKWVEGQGCDWGNYAFEHAAGAKIEVLEWARNNGCPWSFGKLWYTAAEGGHLEILKWATKNRGSRFLREPPSFLMRNSSQKGIP